MAKHVLVCALYLTVGIACLQAQSGSPEPRFEVASVKPNLSGTPGSGPSVRIGQVAIRGESLHIIIWTAYGGSRADFLGLPRWATTETFDITARGNAASMEETIAMLRTLLRDRFSLRLHREEQVGGAYTITRVTPGRLGPQLRPSSSDCSPKAWCTGRLTRGNNVGTGVAWDAVLERIKVAAGGRQLVDQTGISGHFDFELKWSPGLNATPDDAEVDIFQALREQLGLKLESTQAPKSVWVIDQIERPSPD
jgi:uncharacterized protein (TIGR03435 family)